MSPTFHETKVIPHIEGDIQKNFAAGFQKTTVAALAVKVLENRHLSCGSMEEVRDRIPEAVMPYLRQLHDTISRASNMAQVESSLQAMYGAGQIVQLGQTPDGRRIRLAVAIAPRDYFVERSDSVIVVPDTGVRPNNTSLGDACLVLDTLGWSSVAIAPDAYSVFGKLGPRFRKNSEQFNQDGWNTLAHEGIRLQFRGIAAEISKDEIAIMPTYDILPIGEKFSDSFVKLYQGAHDSLNTQFRAWHEPMQGGDKNGSGSLGVVLTSKLYLIQSLGSQSPIVRYNDTSYILEGGVLVPARERISVPNEGYSKEYV